MFGTHPRRAPNHRMSRDSPYGPWLLPGLLIFMALVNQTSGTAAECCPGDAVWLGSTNCSDGSVIRLRCQNNGSFYRLNPEANHFDEFSIIEDDIPRLEFLHNYDSVPATRFCVSGKNETDRWALVCFEDDDAHRSSWKYTVFGILMLISAIFLILTLAVYSILPELRDIQDKAMATTVAFLAASYLLLGTEQLRFHPTDGDIVCIPLAFMLYWTFLSAFFWMNLVAFNIWRSVWFKNFPVKDKDLFVVFCGIGFVGPGFFLIAALVTHNTEGYHLKPHFDEYNCWFVGWTETWAFFYGPITFLLSMNVIYLSLTCWRLWIVYRGYTGSALRPLRYKCLLYVKLVLVMGITWIFEVMSFAISERQDDWYWFATDVLNALQGLVIFILLVATRKRVKRLLARKRPFGITFPKYWAAYDEEDEIHEALDVEIELAKSP